MRTSRVCVALLIFGWLAILASSAHANLIINGSFEADPFTANGNYQLGLIGNAVTGWSIPNGDGVYPWGLQNGAFGASTLFGNQWVVLGRYDTEAEFTIQQTISGLIAGNTYNLSFAIASELECCSVVEASFLSGSSTGAQQFTAPASGSFWTQWQTESLDFLATSSSVTLQFQNIQPSTQGYDLGLDNVVVDGAPAVVPEPTTLLLLGSSLGGLIGRAAWRARRSRLSP